MKYWATLKTLYGERNTRERLLIAATVAATIWGAWIVTLGGHLLDRRAELDQQMQNVLANLREERAAHQTRMQMMSQQQAQLEDKEALRASVALQDEEIELLLEQYVEPAQVNRLLHDLLRQHGGVELKRLSNGQAEEVTLDGVGTGVYRHPFTIEFVGSFPAVYRYLSDLENLQKGLSWQRLNYAVQDYPLALVTLELESLSRHASWVGV